MSALGHYLEDEGLATVSISLVREHVAVMQPPRSLWVPFPLGRPLGVPNDPEFQMQVLQRAFSLFEQASGPVLEDYPDDVPAEPNGNRDVALTCPVALPKEAASSDPTGLREAVASEIAQLLPWYQLSKAERPRDKATLSGLGPEDGARFLDAWLAGQTRESPVEGVSPVDALRSCATDLQAFYIEAAAAQPGQTDPNALREWFWRQSAAGQLLKALRRATLADDDPSIALVGAYMLVADGYAE